MNNSIVYNTPHKLRNNADVKAAFGKSKTSQGVDSFEDMASGRFVATVVSTPDYKIERVTCVNYEEYGKILNCTFWRFVKYGFDTTEIHDPKDLEAAVEAFYAEHPSLAS